MGSEHVQLLRRPLPPKTLQPILKSSLKKTEVLDAVMESISSRVRYSMEGSGWSFHDDTSPLDFDPQLSHVSPTPVSIQSALRPSMSPTITSSFPFRPQRTLRRSLLLELLSDHPRYTQPPPYLSSNHLQKPAQPVLEFTQPDQVLNTMIRSQHTYRKLVDLFLYELHSGQQDQVTNQIFSWEDLPQAQRRFPQIIYELVAQVRMELQARIESRRSTEKSLIQTQQNSVEPWTENKSQTEPINLHLYPVNEVMSCFPVKFFQGSCRSSSPFLAAAECVMISLTELAIIECLTKHGTSLNLKAHFISQLPDLFLLRQNLLYLNLSFNSFTVFPVEVCELARLEVLKLRDNPIEEIPADIQKLLNLKTLIISFCKIRSLPSQLYHLTSLQHLDVSYNLISSLSSEIKNLRSLQYLSVEGNQVEALPVGVVYLRVGVCECCGGVLFGPGLKLIHPVQDLFGLRSVPILFQSCSTSCFSTFRNQPHLLTQTLLTRKTTNKQQL
ncbi:uncharacterized protein LOC111191693 isoform X2 [Astyanax mexicanus]|uniref:uncharacterized protein LOC111191693 isoform X2 n=1 Tax=Astyanax mexicanus TaxID=7994 RepID=UPI0020CB3BA3|nr:uncharacterized protein LOC111191693 isoform X2 [Astyanax mexicanus]